MKLERFVKNKKQKRIIIASIITLLVVVGGITLYRSFAFYQEKQEFNIISGSVPYFTYKDIELAVVVNGETKTSLPEKGLYDTSVTCKNGDDTNGIGEWDYITWDLTLKNFTTGAKCTVYFTSNPNLSEEDLINQGVAKRRNTYRGKDITSYLNDGSLFTMISNGTFDDIYVGDYVTKNNRTYLIADLDNYLYKNSFAKHHATIIPATTLGNAQMNTTETASGGYYNSAIRSELDDTYLSILNTDFGSGHILEFKNLLTNSISEERNSSGSGISGASSKYAEYTRKLDLMSEVNVYGSTIWSSSAYDTGLDDMQFAIFQLKPELKYSYKSNNFCYWLKDVGSKNSFVDVCNGHSFIDAPTQSLGVRPRFFID